MLTESLRQTVVRQANTPHRLVLMVVGSWLLFGALFALTSPEYGLFDSLYLGTVVQSTLGFGDVLPTTVATKVLVMVYVSFCLYFVLPAAIFHVGDAFLASRNAFSEREQAIVKGALLLLLREDLHERTGRPPLDLDAVALIACRAANDCHEDDA